MRLLIAILVLTLACPVVAFDIPVEHRVHNKGNYCTWASIETLGKFHGVRQLDGIMERRREWNALHPRWRGVQIDPKRPQFYEIAHRIDGHNDPGMTSKVKEELDRLDVAYILRADYEYDRDLLWTYANTRGVVVTLKAGNPHSLGCHSIVVVHYDADIVRFYDSSKPLDKEGKPKIWQCSRTWFDQWWAGNAIVILGDGDEAEGESS